MAEVKIDFAKNDNKAVSGITLSTGDVFTNLQEDLKWPDEAAEAYRKSCLSVLHKGLDIQRSISPGVTGLIVGYVQSGKTLSFTGVLALLADNGFKLAIILGGTKNNLLDQTIERLHVDLDVTKRNWKKVKIENDLAGLSRALISNNAPLVIYPLLKHHKHIRDFVNSLVEFGIEPSGLGNVVIIDDEADQASLNTLASKPSEIGETSSTYEQIVSLKAAFPLHIYYQYTATPQAPILIDIQDVLSPDFHYVLDPGIGYVGGIELFRDREHQIVEIPEMEVYHHTDNPLESCPKSLREAVCAFIIATLIHFEVKGHSEVISMMIHPDARHSGADKFFIWVEGLIDEWIQSLQEDFYKNGVIEEFAGVYQKIYAHAFPNLGVPEILSGNLESYLQVIEVKKIRGGASTINWRRLRSVIIVGGELLSRGYTVEGLVVTYMPRTTKSKTNADTLQQRARFFGYKANILDLIRLYLPDKLKEEFKEYVTDEIKIRNFLKSCETSEIAQTISQSTLMRPTRGNVLSSRYKQINLGKPKQFKTIDFECFDYNSSLIDSLMEVCHDRNEWDILNSGSESIDRTHRACFAKIEVVLALISNFKVRNVKDRQYKMSALHCLNQQMEDGETEVYVVDMAFRKECRERGGALKGTVVEINELFSGRSSNYVGDKALIHGEYLTVQIHKVSVLDFPEFGILKTLALFFPEEYHASFASTLLD